MVEKATASSEVSPSAENSTTLEDITLHLGHLELNKLALRYSATSFVRLPGLIAPDDAHRIAKSLQDIPVEKVTNSTSRPFWGRDIYWLTQRNMPLDHPFETFFGQEVFFNLAATLTGREVSRSKYMCWATPGGDTGEIGPHYDVAGLVQFIIGLKAPIDPENGCLYTVHTEPGKTTSIYLPPGDAIAFDATIDTGLKHESTALAPTPYDPKPQRLIADARYYAANTTPS